MVKCALYYPGGDTLMAAFFFLSFFLKRTTNGNFATQIPAATVFVMMTKWHSSVFQMAIYFYAYSTDKGSGAFKGSKESI